MILNIDGKKCGPELTKARCQWRALSLLQMIPGSGLCNDVSCLPALRRPQCLPPDRISLRRPQPHETESPAASRERPAAELQSRRRWRRHPRPRPRPLLATHPPQAHASASPRIWWPSAPLYQPPPRCPSWLRQACSPLFPQRSAALLTSCPMEGFCSHPRLLSLRAVAAAAVAG